MEVPGPFAKYKKFLARADEIRSTQPKLAYYTDFYVAQQAYAELKLEPAKSNPGCRAFLGHLLDQVEELKKELSISVYEDYEECFSFATELFARAHGADQSGTRDARVGRAFLAAGLFLTVVASDVFGSVEDRPANLSKMATYAKLRASQIISAIKAGEEPPAPPISDGSLEVRETDGSSPGEDIPQVPDVSSDRDDPTIPSDEPVDSEQEHSPTEPQTDTVDAVDAVDPKSISFSPPAFPPSESPTSAEVAPVEEPSVEETSAADAIPAQYYRDLPQMQRACAFAKSALEFDDLKEAHKQLTRALTMLNQYM